MRRGLHDGWRLHRGERVDPGAPPDPGRVNAVVPGCVHTDLLAAGHIPDPYLDTNERELGWIGRTDWRYATSFEWADDRVDNVDLVFAGLDTVATIRLNGSVLGHTRNMHRGYRFDARAALRPGTNDLEVSFEAPYAAAERARAELGDLPSIGGEPFAYLRKMACNFGWDWGPKLVTSGIWRPVELHTWSTARLDRVRPLVTVEHGTDSVEHGTDSVEHGTDSVDTGHVEIRVDLRRSGAPRELTLTAQIAGHSARVPVPPHAQTAVLRLTVAAPRLWWPRTLGQPARYPLVVSLHDGPREVDRWTRTVGFRTIELDTAEDAHGSAFTFAVNGVPMFARGVNWIPDDCFPHRVDRTRYRERLRQAADANVDLVRVWGGGLYEGEDFYDTCDELGLLVWQDFPFACAAYPEDEDTRAEVLAEAEENVARLMPHPSLALWNGCNENIWGVHEWGWAPRLAGRAWGLEYYLRLLPEVVSRVDPTRPYWPGSPYSGSPDLDANLPERGCMHIWDVWNRRDYTGYRDYVPRFVAEFGYLGAPARSTLAAAVHDEPLTPTSPGMAAHQKAIHGLRKLDDRLREHFPAGNDADLDDWHFRTQVLQARAARTGIEHFRSHRGRCMGTVWWQLNDCWPVVSWSVIDGAGRPKPAWYALRAAYADRLLTIQPRGDGLAVVAVNDAADAWTVDAVVRRHDFDGTVLAEHALSGSCPPRGTLELALPTRLAEPGDAARELLRVHSPDRPADWFFLPDKELDYPAARFTVETRRVGGDLHVTVRAGSLLRDLCLLADLLAPGAVADEALRTLLPGERARFVVRGAPSGTEPDPTPALRCVNDIPAPVPHGVSR